MYEAHGGPLAACVLCSRKVTRFFVNSFPRGSRAGRFGTLGDCVRDRAIIGTSNGMSPRRIGQAGSTLSTRHGLHEVERLTLHCAPRPGRRSFISRRSRDNSNSVPDFVGRTRVEGRYCGRVVVHGPIIRSLLSLNRRTVVIPFLNGYCKD